LLLREKTFNSLIAFCLGKKSRGQQPLVESDPLVAVVNMRPEILQQMLQTVLNIIMFEDCRNQWSMSRPLLGLILLNEEYFQNLRDQIVASQPPDKRGPMMSWFDSLMEGIERNLLTKNRDRYKPN
jgi:exportin-7